MAVRAFNRRHAYLEVNGGDSTPMLAGKTSEEPFTGANCRDVLRFEAQAGTQVKVGFDRMTLFPLRVFCRVSVAND